MYSQVYWTRNNPIDLPPELVNSIGRKLFNLFPGKILCKKRQDLTWKISREEIFSENKYFQRWNIFRKEFFQVKRFQGKVMAITGYEVDQVVLNRRPSPSPYQANQLIIFATQRNPRWPTQVTRKSQRTPKIQTRRVLVGLPAILIAAKVTNRWTKFHNMFIFKTDRRN